MSLRESVWKELYRKKFNNYSKNLVIPCSNASVLWVVESCKESSRCCGLWKACGVGIMQVSSDVCTRCVWLECFPFCVLCIVVCWLRARLVKASTATSREKSFDKNEVEANLNINGYPRNILVPDIAVLAERHNDKFQARAFRFVQPHMCGVLWWWHRKHGKISEDSGGRERCRRLSSRTVCWRSSAYGNQNHEALNSTHASRCGWVLSARRAIRDQCCHYNSCNTVGEIRASWNRFAPCYDRISDHAVSSGHTSFFSCSLRIELHAFHTAWLKTSHPMCLCVRFHLHVIHDVCLSVRWLSFVFLSLLFLSVVYLSSSTLYRFFARHSIFNVDTAEG